MTFPIETQHLPSYQRDVVAFGMKIPKVIYLLILLS